MRDAEMLDALDPVTSDLPLDQLRDVATVEGNGPATLQVVDDGTRIAVGFLPSVEGTPAELERSGDVARVTGFTDDDQQVSADTLAVGSSSMDARAAWSASATTAPPCWRVEVGASQLRFRQHSPRLKGWTASCP